MVKSSKKTPQQAGKDFEGRVQAVLSDLQRTSRVYFHRLYDSHSAGAYLPSQPGDFIAVADGKACLIEVKSSLAVESLSESRKALTSLFDVEQLTKMKLWARARGSASVIFQSQETKAIEVWDGVFIRDCFVTPRLRANVKARYLFKPTGLVEACKFMLNGRMF